MIGCLKRVGCVVVLLMMLALAVAAWFGRDFWLPMLPFGPRAAQTTGAAWEAPTPQGALRADAALKRLQVRNGPAYANISAGDMIAYVLKEFARNMPSSTDSIRTAVVGDRLHVRARVRTADLGGQAVLGPLAWLLDSERERVEFGGTLHVIRPGLTEYQVKTFKVREFALPPSLIPTLIRQISRDPRPSDVAPDGLPLTTPPYIGDVRVAGGRITIYRKP